ncbi:MAG: ribonuclease P protein component [candidate division WOR-3 bacterium]|nr:ribonuclease P protein component [candidate division WOR-3 bacterium]
MRESLKREEIVRGHRLLMALVRSGKKVSGNALILSFHQQPEHNQESIPPCRVAIHLSKKIKGAVVRNRLKRRLREIFRRNKNWFSPGFDYLFQARPSAVHLTFDQLKHELQHLACATNFSSPNKTLSPSLMEGNKRDGANYCTNAINPTKPVVYKQGSGNAQNPA